MAKNTEEWESDLLRRDAIMLREKIFQHGTVDKSFPLCIIHTGWHFSVVVNQAVYLLEDESVLSSDKKNNLIFLLCICLG